MAQSLKLLFIGESGVDAVVHELQRGDYTPVVECATNLAELETVLEQIEARLERGTMPPRIKRRTSILSVNFLL